MFTEEIGLSFLLGVISGVGIVLVLEKRKILSLIRMATTPTAPTSTSTYRRPQRKRPRYGGYGGGVSCNDVSSILETASDVAFDMSCG